MQAPTLIFVIVLCLAGWAAPAAADDLPLTPPLPIKPMEMIRVKGGCYQMGDTFDSGAPDERPVHNVCVKDFQLGTYLVTQMEWVGALGLNPSAEPVCGLTCPVENISWNDVQQFIKRLSELSGRPYRLPTEAEWEYAARSGGKNEKWAGTSSDKELGDYVWYYNNSRFQTHPVGLKKPNGLGLYDMSGNVSEWVADLYDRDYYATSPSDDPKGPADGRARVLRGGYWGDLSKDVRVTRRISVDPSARAPGFGVRLALPPQ